MLLAAVLLSLWATAVLGRLQFWGVAIAGADFGCQPDGTCPLDQAQVPLTELGGADGLGQMRHFVNDDQFNVFRLPVSWQFLVNNTLGGPLDPVRFGQYDQLMQACLSTGAYCMIDVHNFARWNGRTIGQNGPGPPTDEPFINLWQQLAAWYAAEERVMFAIMNEPHDLDIELWAVTCQKTVTAIRNANATSQLILLPGTNFASAATLVSSGSADLLMNITNPDGSTKGLLLDIHKYLDDNNSGTHGECVMDNVANFTIVADYLRKVGRQGFVSETGAGTWSTSGCFEKFCAQNNYIAANPDVFVGFIGWGAGNFSTTYLLSLTPVLVGDKYYDNAISWQCVVGPWLYPNTTTPPVPSPTSTSAASATTSPSGGMRRSYGVLNGVISTVVLSFLLVVL